MWIKVRVKFTKRENNFGRVTGPAVSGHYLVTLKIEGERRMSIAEWCAEDCIWRDENHLDICKYVIAYTEDFSDISSAYDDGRRNERFIQVIPLIDLITAEKSLNKYKGETIAKYSFNNIEVVAKIVDAGTRTTPHNVILITISDNNSILHTIKEPDCSFFRLEEYIKRVIDYSSYMSNDSDNIQDNSDNIQDDSWHVCLSEVVDNVVTISNGPQKTGDYLCTCVMIGGSQFNYLQVMHWDYEHKVWCDVGRKGISHIVLAWSEQKPCTFDDYIYNAGGYLTKITKK